MIQDNVVLGKQPKLSKRSTSKAKAPLAPLEIGAGAAICSGAVVYAGTVIGPDVIVGDLATVRERCALGEGVVVGRGVCVENDVPIGAFTKIQSNSYITAYSELEEHVFVAPCVTTTNDNYMGRTEARHGQIKGAIIRRGARVGGGVVILPGIEIGAEAFVAAGALVTRDVPPGKLVAGPAGPGVARRARPRRWSTTTADERPSARPRDTRRHDRHPGPRAPGAPLVAIDLPDGRRVMVAAHLCGPGHHRPAGRGRTPLGGPGRRRARAGGHHQRWHGLGGAPGGVRPA